MLTEEEKEYAEEIEKYFPAEILLIKEADREQYETFIKHLAHEKHMANEYAKRMNTFVDMAADATGRPYIIDTGSNLDVADVLFNMTDEWLRSKGKRSFGQVFLNVLLKLICNLIVFSPLILFMIFYWMHGEHESRYFFILGFLVPVFGMIALALYELIEKWIKNKRKSE